MTRRIDRVVTMPGLIARARTYTVIGDDGGLFLLRTGNATREVPTPGIAGAIAEGMLVKIQQKYDREIVANEQLLASMSPTDYAAQGKNCVRIPRAEVKAVEIKTGYSRGGQYPIVVVRAAKKYSLHFGMSSAAEVQQLFAPYL
jgi:hypothetical protein